MIPLNVFLGTGVAAVGLWMLWDAIPPRMLAGWIVAVGGFLWWKGRTLTEVWAWSTLLLGLESFTWPLVLMIQLKTATATPSDEQMGAVLSAVVLGLFSAVFWLSFSYGLFKRARAVGSDSASPAATRGSCSRPGGSR